MSSIKKKKGLMSSIKYILMLAAILMLAVFVYPEIPELSKYFFDEDKPDTTGEVNDTPADLDDEEVAVDPGREVSDPFEDENEETEVDDKAATDNDTCEGPELKVISDGDYLLALVTKETTLKSDYEPPDLKPVPSYMNPSRDMQLREEALWHLEKLWDAANEDGVSLSIRSAYRSYNTQKRLFADYASRHGEEEANRFSARAGQSEHQLGTAVDFGGTGVDFSPEFGQTDQGRWLAENAHYFGFAMSYPEGKEYITGYVYEPWHYRYIGVDQAIEWKESGVTLKEYLEKQPQDFE